MLPAFVHWRQDWRHVRVSRRLQTDTLGQTLWPWGLPDVMSGTGALRPSDGAASTVNDRNKVVVQT